MSHIPPPRYTHAQIRQSPAGFWYYTLMRRNPDGSFSAYTSQVQCDTEAQALRRATEALAQMRLFNISLGSASRHFLESFS